MKKAFFGAICALAMLTACNAPQKSEPISGLKRADFQSEQQGKQTDLYTLTNKNGMEVCVTNFGGRIVSIMVPDKDGNMQDVVIGYSNITDYATKPSDFGASVGRYANRIANGVITIDDVVYDLPKNNFGHCLHGGCTLEPAPMGWQNQVFDVEKVTDNQIDDLMEEIDARVRRGDKVLVTTLTKRMAEELSRYFDRVGVRNRYIHSDIETLERVQILDDLRAGSFDVLVGVNLLREGLDLPEVGLVAIMDADKEGFLRNVRSITQIAGRAARHAQGNVIMYAERCTESMRLAIEESNRRREKQLTFNIENQMLPRQAQKSGSGRNNLLELAAVESEGATAKYTPLETLVAPIAADVRADYKATGTTTEGDTLDVAIATAREQMERAAKELDFMAAAKFRDLMYELQRRKEEQR